jgi:hypothetical protein
MSVNFCAIRTAFGKFCKHDITLGMALVQFLVVQTSLASFGAVVKTFGYPSQVFPMEPAFRLLGHVVFPSFKTPSSASFTVCVPRSEAAFTEQKRIVYHELGWIDLHRDCSGEFQTRIRMSLPSDIQDDDNIETIRGALFDFLGIRDSASWMIRLYASESVRWIEHRDPSGLRDTST